PSITSPVESPDRYGDGRTESVGTQSTEQEMFCPDFSGKLRPGGVRFKGPIGPNEEAGSHVVLDAQRVRIRETRHDTNTTSDVADGSEQPPKATLSPRQPINFA